MARRSFYVDATNGRDQASGVSESRAKATITAALALTVDGRGDTIYVAPGTYDENVIVTKDYVTLVGTLPGGYARPDLAPDAGVALTVQAQGFVARHMRFATADDDAVVQQGNGFLYEDCVFDGAGTAAKAGVRLLPLNTDHHLSASEGLITRSLIRGNAFGVIFDTATELPDGGTGSTDNQIRENTFRANTVDIATKDSGTTNTYSVQLTQIGPDNIFADKNKAVYVDLTTENAGAASDQTGVITDNLFNTDAFTTTNIKMVGTGFGFTGNRSNLGVADGTGLD